MLSYDRHPDLLLVKVTDKGYHGMLKGAGGSLHSLFIFNS